MRRIIMETKNRSIDVEKLCRLIAKGEYCFDMAIQRLDGQWNHEQQSLLIDSMIRGYFIPAIWITRTGTEAYVKNSVIDGKQRSITIYSYLNDGFKLHKSIEPITLKADDYEELEEDVTYELAGKKFSQLPKIIQNIIKDYTIDVIQMLYYTEDEIEEQFFRLNNGATFTKAQKANVLLGGELSNKIKEITDMSFWERTAFSNNQRKRGEIIACVLQCLMVLTDYNYKSFGVNEVLKFADYYSENYNDKEIEYLKELIIKLDQCLPYDDEINKFLKKINIPAMIMNVNTFMTLDNLNDELYSNFLNEWIKGNAEISGYIENCGTASTSMTKVKNRVAIMDEWLQSYADNIMLSDISIIKVKESGVIENEEEHKTAQASSSQ